MARTLVRASVQSLNATTPDFISGVTYPGLSVAGWVNPAVVNVQQIAWSYVNSDLQELAYLMISAAGVVTFNTTHAGPPPFSTGATVIAANVWTHLGVSFDTTVQALYVNGGNKTTATSRPSNQLITISLGGMGGGNMFGGRLGEWGFWGVVLTDDEFAQLARGMSPRGVRPQSLLSVWELHGQQSPEPDLTGRYPLTLVNAPTAGDHPPIYKPTRPRVGLSFVGAVPTVPTNLSPADGAPSQVAGMALMFSSVGATTYDVLFGTVNPPVTTVSADQTGAAYVPTVLPATTYYWQVVAKNSAGTSAAGPIWSFTTTAGTGQPLVMFDASESQPPLTAFATRSTRNGHAILQFDAAIAESAHFTSVLPRHYQGGGITVRIAWTGATATSGTVTWTIAIERHDTATDLDADSFATGVSVTAITDPVSGNLTYTDLALTNAQIDGLLVGEHFRLKITRAIGGLTGDAELHGLDLRET